jgi:hypothetical protein
MRIARKSIVQYAVRAAGDAAKSLARQPICSGRNRATGMSMPLAYRVQLRFKAVTQSRRDAMPRGDKSSYTAKQKRQAGDIEKSYERKGISTKEAERRAWATVNKTSGGGKKSGSGKKTATRKTAKKTSSKRATARKPTARKTTRKTRKSR